MPCQVGADLTSRVQDERTKFGLAKYKAGFDGAKVNQVALWENLRDEC